MAKCEFILNSGKRCSRNARRNKKYCYQHKSHGSLLSKIPKFRFTIFAGVVSIVWIASRVYVNFIKPTLEQKGIIEMVCDRNIENGCSLDIEYYNFQALEFLDPDTQEMFGGVTTLGLLYDNKIYDIVIEFGDIKSHVSDYNFETNGNKILKFLKRFIEIKVINSKLVFSGKIYDFKSEELIGWFNGNEFGTNGCGISWNRDDNSVEILDHYGNVCFSAEYVSATKDNKSKPVLVIAGYFKLNGVYHIIDNKIRSTSNMQEAEKYIKEIKPIFNHYGKNSTGQRIYERLKLRLEPK